MLRSFKCSARGFLASLIALFPLILSTGLQAAQWANPGVFATADEVEEGLRQGDWVVVDCRDLKDYIKGHIPGAISFGQSCKKALRDPSSRVFPDASKYEKFLSRVGISNDTHVAFYYEGLKTLTDATVAFWVMEYLGHEKAHVLNGGIDAWRKAGNRLDNEPVQLEPASFKANVNPEILATSEEILRIANGETEAQLVDSRTTAENQGKDIRAVRGGQVPNTVLQISHLDTLRHEKNPKSGEMEATAYLDPDVAGTAFSSLDKSKRVVSYCQTGTRSTMTYLQLRALGFQDLANWDDSWRVYGSKLEYPVEGEQWYNFAGLNKKIATLEKQLEALEKAKE